MHQEQTARYVPETGGLGGQIRARKIGDVGNGERWMGYGSKFLHENFVSTMDHLWSYRYCLFSRCFQGIPEITKF